MNKIVVLMIIGLLIIGGIALNKILNSPDVENTPTNQRQTASNPTPTPSNNTTVPENPETPPSHVMQS